MSDAKEAPDRENRKNRKVRYEWCQYHGQKLYVVRRIVAEDFAMFHTQADAYAFIDQMEKGERND